MSVAAHTVLLSVIGAVAAAPCFAQDTAASYPSQPVKVVVSYAAGNTTDVLARLVGDRLAQAWKKPVVIENKPGVAGSLGAAQVAKAKPDGTTLLFTAVAAMAVNPHVYPQLGYDALNDFEWMHLVAFAPLVCVVPASMPVASFDDLVKRSHTSTINYGTAGSGNIPHLAVETFKARFGLKATHVPYKAAAQIATDLASGDIQFACDAASALLPMINTGRIKPIVATSKARLSALPSVPTMAEQYNGYTVGAWLGLAAPKGTPQGIVQKISADTARILADKDTVAKLDTLGFEVLSLGPAEFTERVRHDHQQFGVLARELKLKPE